jgi:hypothetical protein
LCLTLLVLFSFVAVALADNQTLSIFETLSALGTRFSDFLLSSCSLNSEKEIGIGRRVLFAHARISYRLCL